MHFSDIYVSFFFVKKSNIDRDLTLTKTNIDRDPTWTGNLTWTDT